MAWKKDFKLQNNPKEKQKGKDKKKAYQLTCMSYWKYLRIIVRALMDLYLARAMSTNNIGTVAAQVQDAGRWILG